MSEKYLRHEQLQRNLSAAISAMQKVAETKNHLSLQWQHEGPKRRANQVYQMLGTPAMYTKEQGGCAIWKNVNSTFTRVYHNDEKFDRDLVYLTIKVKDEMIPHLLPGPHNDWMYAEMWMDIPKDRLSDVRGLSESLEYDALKKTITVRCHFMVANIVTLFLAKRIAEGDETLANAREQYSVLIGQLSNEQKDEKGVGNEKVGLWHTALLNYIFS